MKNLKKKKRKNVLNTKGKQKKILILALKILDWLWKNYIR